MKQAELTRALKAELWSLFTKGADPQSMSVTAKGLPQDAVQKQYGLWREHRKRKRKASRV